MVLIRAFLLIRVAAEFAFILPACVVAQQSHRIELHQYEGKLGRNRIGLTVVRRGNTIQGGHYFYQKFLRDIPIVGSFDGAKVTLRESGGQFDLHFVGNGSEHGQPLDFENSIGMDGEWMSADGGRIYPVSMRGAAILLVSNGERRYGEVTKDTDGAFEKRVQLFWRSALRGDNETAAKFVSYPLTVNFSNRKRRSFATPTALLAEWNNIFTPALIANLKRDLPHDMFVHNGMATLGNGEAWFDDKGLSVVNVPAVRHD